ncbi:PEP-CTERM sorting domain-containing protein [Rubritalea spongiae]|uniref:PEP-CTERM sorting domain-containing protein n=1 Tax=Rubritalea spongiae TaxID=430797 RepID=A0ABW5E099_9BACT
MNGGFDSTGTPLPGWDLNAPAGTTFNQTNIDIHFGASPTTESFMARFAGSKAEASVSQIVATVTGQEYHVQFDYGFSNINPASNDQGPINVVGGMRFTAGSEDENTSAPSYWAESYDAISSTSGQFVTYEFTFTAQTDTTKITFLDILEVTGNLNDGSGPMSSGHDADSFLDTVILTKVPEPSTSALTLLSSGLLLLRRQR